MPFIPSLLEYNPQNLKKRLELVTNYSDIFENIQKANDQKIHLHLDFVLPEFAKKRQVQHGILPQETIESINNHFEDDDSLVLNMHFMGSEKDLTDSLNYLKTLKFKRAGLICYTLIQLNLTNGKKALMMLIM